MTHSRIVPLSVLLIIGAQAVSSDLAASDWTRFRGPNGSGIAMGQDLPIEWVPENTLWKVKLPGIGNSSPIVSGQHLFLQSSSSDGKERHLICLDARSGKTQWSKQVPGDRVKIHSKNTLSSSTPATDGERVYGLFWDGKGLALHAFDFTGKPVWKRDLGSYKSQHGAGTSPVVYGGKVIVNNDQDGAASVVAFDAKTGQPAWQTPREPFRACYSSPFVIERAGAGPELIVTSTAGIGSYSLKDGKQNWSWKWPFSGSPLRTVGSAIAHQGLIVLTSGDGNGARNMTVVDLGGGKPSLLWSKEKGTPYVPGVVAAGDQVYYVNDLGMAGCFSARTGENGWLQRLSGGVTASLVLIDGNVFAITEEGVVHVFAAEPSFKPLAKNVLGESVMATPAVANGRMYIRGGDHLFCIGKK